MKRLGWSMLLLAPMLLGLGLGSPQAADAIGTLPSVSPAPPRPPSIATPRAPVIATPVPPTVPLPTPTPQHLLGGPPAGSCAGAYLVPQAGHSFPPATPPEHGALLGLSLAPGAVGLPDNSYYYVDVLNGAVNHTNCTAVGLEVSLVQTLPFGDPRKGVVADWMAMGAHTVVQVNAYASGSSPPFSGLPTYSAYYGTQRAADPTVINPLYTTVAPGVPFANVWNTTGELATLDTLDWLTQHGTCNSGCDFSGYTLHDLTLRQTDGGVFYPYAPNATFRNVKFQAGMQLQLSNFRNAIFDNVEMDATNLSGADFSGARFINTNTISNADISGTNFSGASFSSETHMVGLRVGKNLDSLTCTSFANANLLPPTLQISSIGDACVSSTPVFSGAQVRPSITAASVWRQISWSGATIVWDATDRGYLKGQDLTGVDLSKATMRGVPADLTNTNFTGARLNGASLQGVNLSGATLTGVSAQGTSFDGANLTNARLNQPQGSTTRLDGASFQKTSLDGASFNGSSILGTNFGHASAHGSTDFGNTRAAGAVFDGAHILGNAAAFEGAVFDPDPSTQTGDASFNATVLGGNISSGQGINFQGTHLRNAHFNQAQCIGCIFSGTDLTNANFSGSYLLGAVFSGATLTRALFTDALLANTSGTWTFQLGVGESPVAISYGPTDFTGAGTTAVQSCPDGDQPDTTNGCAGRTTANTPPRVPAACSAAGEEACPSPVTTIAGNGTSGSALTQVADPSGIVVARNGDVFFADTGNHVVRKITAGTVTTFVGQPGIAGDSGDGGSAGAALLEEPVGLALGVDNPPTVYISDRLANRVRKVVQSFDSSGNPRATISAVAGNGQACAAPAAGCGDGGDPLQAQLNGPEAIWTDPLGNVYIADTQSNKVRLAVAAGNIRTLAGTGANGSSGDGGPAAAASFSQPAGIAGDSYGNVYIADTGNSRIRRIDPAGQVATVFGTGVAGYNGTFDQDPITFAWTYPKNGTAAQLNHPRGLTTDVANGLYVADTGNGLVRRLNTTSGAIGLLAGKTHEAGKSSTIDTSFTGDNLPANQTGFNAPKDVAITLDGTYRVTDTGHLRVRSFGPSSV